MKTTTFILLISLFLLFGKQNSLAQNLVPNPSFEDTINSCPSWWSQTNTCKNWYSPIGTTPDYFNSCGTGKANVPYTGTGYQLARTGEAYGGIIPNIIDSNIWWTEWNEYLSVQLKTPLIVGQVYVLKMYLNLADKSQHTTSSIGVLCTNTPISIFQYNNGFISTSPQILNNSGNFIGNKVNWTEIKQNFVADSAYQHITIGNFLDRYNTPLLNTGINSGWEPSQRDFPYFLIDDVSLTPINTICFGDSIALTSQGDTLYAWANSLNPSVIISNDSILTVNPTTNTIYYDYSNGDTAEYIVNVMGNGALKLGNDTNLCPRYSLLLNAAISNSTYLWQDGSTNYKYEVTQGGIYWVQVTNSCGIFTDTITVTYNTIPVNLGADKTLCIGQSLTLSPNISNATYLWQNFSINQSLFIPSWISTSGEYWVIVSDTNGCGIDTIYIDYLPFFNNDFLINDTSLCDGDTLLIKAPAPNNNYQWSTGSTDSSIIVTQTGSYWVEVNNQCYTESDTANITFKPTPYFELGNDLILCDNEKLVLGVNTIPNAIVWWNTSFTISTIIIEKEGQYIATASYQGCYFKDTINITYENCEIILKIPNVFTPNADGFNDLFQLNGENINTINIKILNRWGQLVFESNDINHSWNGVTKEGKTCNEGTYFYVITAKNEQTSKVFKGAITLLR